MTDAEGVESAENIVYEDAVLFYNPAKSRFDENDYLATIPYGEKGLSREFLAYFAQFLQESADQGLDASKNPNLAIVHTLFILC